jgi:hypothetical protein
MNQFQAGGAILLCLTAVCEAQIKVNLYNDSAVSDEVMDSAQKEASRILRDAGVMLSWCRRTIPGEPCASPGTATLQVRLCPRAAEANYAVPANSMGFSLTSPAPEFGFFAGILVQRMAAFTRGDQHRYELMLGHVIAHELGHLLLERSAHSRNGLMKDQWDRPQWDLMETGRLLFSRDEARLIQARVKLRQQAAEGTSDGK